MKPVRVLKVAMATDALSNHRRWEIVFNGEQIYNSLLKMWLFLLETQGSCAMMLVGATIHSSHVIQVVVDHSVEYIRGQVDHNSGRMTARVTMEWVDDVLKMWKTMEHGPPPSDGHWPQGTEYFLSSKGKRKQGVRKNGYDFLIKYNCLTNVQDCRIELFPRVTDAGESCTPPGCGV